MTSLVLTRGWLPGVRTARVVVDGGAPRRLRAGQVLTLDLGAGPHEVRVLAGGARSHLHRVVLEDAVVCELEVGTSWPDDVTDAAPVPALVGADDAPAPVARRGGVPFDQSQWPFWSFLLGLVAPPVGIVVAAVALRRPGVGSVNRALVVAGLVAGASSVLALVAGVVWVVTAGAQTVPAGRRQARARVGPVSSAVRQADRLRTVRYDIRGPLLRRAREIEAAGHEVVKLNIGNPAAWGLAAPDAVVRGLVEHINDAEGYSDARGILPAREAVADYYTGRGVVGVGPDHVMLGNGVSELIVMTLQALLDPGDQVLVPSPDYPLWTGAVRLSGGTAVHYRCAEEDGWQPDVADVAAKVSPATKALVLINPNNPTGAVYSRETLLALLDVARQHGLLVLADEIYDHILFDGPDGPVVHEHAAALAPDLVVLTLCGLSKNHRAAGFRSAWLAVSGPRERAADYLDGLELLANMRMCPNVPAQHAVASALADRASIDPLLAPGGRLREQRDHMLRRLNAIPGVSCVEPRGALYLFAKLDPAAYPVDDDEALVMDLLNAEHLLLTHGTGFNLPTPDHLRMVFLAPVEVLDDAADRLQRFLAGRHR